MVEIVDIYDRFNRKTGQTCERDKVPKGMCNLVSVMCFITKKGELLLQKRANTKICPSKWDFSAGGGALAGETPIENIKREVYEELGLEIDMEDTLPFDVTDSYSCIVTYFVKECDKSILGKINCGEKVSEVRFVNYMELRRLMLTGEFRSDFNRMTMQKILTLMQRLEDGFERSPLLSNLVWSTEGIE